MDVSLQNGIFYSFKKGYIGLDIDSFIYRMGLSFLMFVCLVYPVYKFIYSLSVRKLEEKDFLERKKYIRNKAILLSVLINFIFVYVYSIKMIWK